MWNVKYQAYDDWDFADAIATTLKPVLRYDIVYRRWIAFTDGEWYVQTAPEVKAQIAKIADLLLASNVLEGPGGHLLERFQQQMTRRPARKLTLRMVQSSLRHYIGPKPIDLIPLVTLTGFYGRFDPRRTGAHN